MSVHILKNNLIFLIYESLSCLLSSLFLLPCFLGWITPEQRPNSPLETFPLRAGYLGQWHRVLKKIFTGQSLIGTNLVSNVSNIKGSTLNWHINQSPKEVEKVNFWWYYSLWNGKSLEVTIFSLKWVHMRQSL